MTSTVKVALGIDVTDAHVNMVVLKKDRHRLTVLNAVQVDVPKGVVEGGHVVDTAGLTRLVKAARRRYRIGRHRVAVSLPPATTLERIVPLDEENPQRIVQFVAGEVQQYAAFSGRETASDFRVLAPLRPDKLGKILIVASDRQAVSTVTQTCHNAGCRVSVAEPAIMACMRALRFTTSPDRIHDNSLLALLKNGTLTVCVFLAGTLTFVRTKVHDSADAGPETIYPWVAEEINAVLGFCGIEHGCEPEGWGITVIDEDHACVGEDVEHAFRAKVASKVLRLATQASLPEGTVIGPHGGGVVSTTAFGLAIRLLDLEERSPRVNLMPSETSGSKSAQRAVLVGSIAISFFTLLVLVAVGALEYRHKQVSQRIVAKEQAGLQGDERTLAVAATELAYVERRIGSLDSEYEYLKHIAESRREVDWAQLLTDLKGAVPERLQITDLSTQDNNEMLLRGVSNSYESVHVFVQMLNRSASISRAAVLQTSRDDVNGLVRYAVRCALNATEAQ